MNTFTFKGFIPEGAAKKALQRLAHSFRTRATSTGCIGYRQGQPILGLGKFSSPVRRLFIFLNLANQAPFDVTWDAETDSALPENAFPGVMFSLHNCGGGENGTCLNDDVALFSFPDLQQERVIFVTDGPLDAAGVIYCEEVLADGSLQAWLVLIHQTNGENRSSTYCGPTNFLFPLAAMLLEYHRMQLIPPSPEELDTDFYPDEEAAWQ